LEEASAFVAILEVDGADSQTNSDIRWTDLKPIQLADEF
jgi:hypothetical protein